jgi:hypothetical protein
MLAVARPSAYELGGPSYVAMPAQLVDGKQGGQLFNPGYLTAQIQRKADEDLRLLLGKQYDTLRLEDDVKAYFFFRWVLEQLDPDRTRLEAWLLALEDPAADLDAAAALLRPAPRAGERALDALDRAFREQHLRAYPKTGPLLPDWTGTWKATPATIGYHNQAARKNGTPILRSVVIEVNPDGTCVHTRDEDGSDPVERRGTWDPGDEGIQLSLKGGLVDLRPYENGLSDGRLVFVRKKRPEPR